MYLFKFCFWLKINIFKYACRLNSYKMLKSDGLFQILNAFVKK